MSFLPRPSKASAINAVYLVNLLISFHYFLVIYINSAFLSQYIYQNTVSLLYIIGSILSVVLFIFFIDLIKKLGNYRLLLIFIFLEILSLLGLGFFNNSTGLMFSFILFLIVSPIIYLNLDVFLEGFTRDESVTGTRRGVFLTMINIAQVMCPLIAGMLLAQNEYWRVYSISIAFLLGAALLTSLYLRHFKDPHYKYFTLQQMAKELIKKPTLFNVFSAQFLLRFFYAWMVIYMPLYLFITIGFSWPTIGAIFTIMLLPFLLLELPLGRLADSWFSEKRMLIVGFCIMALSVALIPFITIRSFPLWALLLCLTRIGASFTEVGTESYFFKHVDGAFADTISFFRVARPATYVLSALVALASTIFIPMRWDFLILSAIMLLGLYFASQLPQKTT